MKIDWLSNQNQLGAITIYQNNITLNKQAADFFSESYCVAVGIDRETNNLVIKSVTKEEFENASESVKAQFHKLAIKKSYGRITGKQMIDELAVILNLDFNKQLAYKYSAKWNTGYKMLIATTNKDGEKNA